MMATRRTLFADLVLVLVLVPIVVVHVLWLQLFGVGLRYYAFGLLLNWVWILVWTRATASWLGKVA